MELDYKPLVDLGEGEPIILLHGLFGSLSNWGRVVYEFSATNRVMVPRLPFYSTPISTERLNDLVQYIENFVQHHKLEKVTVMGNSLGGHVALLYSWQNPSQVKKLVLAGSSGLFENSFGGSFPRVRDYEYIKEKVHSTFYKTNVVTRQLVDEVYETVQSRSKTLNIIALARAAQRNNVSHKLSQVTCPTLLIWGLQDTVTPPEVALEFDEHLPNSELVFIDHCGHVPMMEQPEIFNRYVRDFLERNEH